MLLLVLVLLPPAAGSAGKAPRIALLTPGEGSRVASPIQVSADIQSSPGGLLRLTLLDRAGNEVSRQLLHVDAVENGKSQPFSTQLTFEISPQEETGLLTILLLDSDFRPIALRSAEITLLAEGKPQIETPRSDEPWVTLIQPLPGESFTGRKITVLGSVTPLSAAPIILELVANDGRVVGSSQVRVPLPESTFDFSADLYYDFINTPTEVRLVIRQAADAFKATAILDSLLINVAP